MQQINQIADNLFLIQQGNNSYIHRKTSESETVVIKSVFHGPLFIQDESVCEQVHQRECQDLINEWKILSQLNHPNIIRAQQFIPNHQLNPTGNLQCCSLYLENATCDLLTLCKSNDTPLKIIIKYFTQISHAVEYLHTLYIAHNDIKLENILVINRNVVKLADFGFSYRPSYEDLLLKWLPRTLTCYTSPEIINFRINHVDGQYDQEFNLFAADVYALTTALFMAIYKRSPIKGQYPINEDIYYQYLLNEPDLFWQLEFIQKIDNQLLREHTPKLLLESLKDLIEGGLAEEDNRITISEFVNHDFFKQAQQLEGDI